MTRSGSRPLRAASTYAAWTMSRAATAETRYLRASAATKASTLAGSAVRRRVAEAGSAGCDSAAGEATGVGATGATARMRRSPGTETSIAAAAMRRAALRCGWDRGSASRPARPAGWDSNSNCVGMKTSGLFRTRPPESAATRAVTLLCSLASLVLGAVRHRSPVDSTPYFRCRRMGDRLCELTLRSSSASEKRLDYTTGRVGSDRFASSPRACHDECASVGFA
jgi:hypothetical protein